MSNSHLRLAKQNITFYKDLCDSFPDQYFDWKTTVIFYTSLHLIEALAEEKSVQLGKNHHERFQSIDPNGNGNMPIKEFIFSRYCELKDASEFCRYKPPLKMKVFQDYLRDELGKNYTMLLDIAAYVSSNSKLEIDFLKAA